MTSSLLALILPSAALKQFLFDWYPIFGVGFMACLLVLFFMLMRTTRSSTKPETVKANKTSPVLWDEVQRRLVSFREVQGSGRIAT